MSEQSDVFPSPPAGTQAGSSAGVRCSCFSGPRRASAIELLTLLLGQRFSAVEKLLTSSIASESHDVCTLRGHGSREIHHFWAEGLAVHVNDGRIEAVEAFGDHQPFHRRAPCAELSPGIHFGGSREGVVAALGEPTRSLPNGWACYDNWRASTGCLATLQHPGVTIGFQFFNAEASSGKGDAADAKPEKKEKEPKADAKEGKPAQPQPQPQPQPAVAAAGSAAAGGSTDASTSASCAGSACAGSPTRMLAVPAAALDLGLPGPACAEESSMAASFYDSSVLKRPLDASSVPASASSAAAAAAAAASTIIAQSLAMAELPPAPPARSASGLLGQPAGATPLSVPALGAQLSDQSPPATSTTPALSDFESASRRTPGEASAKFVLAGTAGGSGDGFVAASAAAGAGEGSTAAAPAAKKLKEGPAEEAAADGKGGGGSADGAAKSKKPKADKKDKGDEAGSALPTLSGLQSVRIDLSPPQSGPLVRRSGPKSAPAVAEPEGSSGLIQIAGHDKKFHRLSAGMIVKEASPSEPF